MRSDRVCSMIEDRPRAPVLRSFARAAIAKSASCVNSRSMPSSSKRCWYWRTREFDGSVRTRTRSSSVSSFVEVRMGRRPINSGIMPNLCRSSADTASYRSPISEVLFSSEPKPVERRPRRPLTISSMPANAPAAMKRMPEVSISRNCWWGCLRPPVGGTEATVPSMIFRSACWTPSPDTSRVIEAFSALRPILSISST